MHVLIIILKIIGCMLAFLLLLLLLLLIMPICYRFELKKEDAPFFARGRVSYFLRALLFDAGYEDETFYYRLRIFGKEVLSKEYKEESASEEPPAGEQKEESAEGAKEKPETKPEDSEAKKEEARENIKEQQQIHEEEALKEKAKEEALKEDKKETQKEKDKKEPLEESFEEEKEPKPSVFDKINELLNKVEKLEKKKEKLKRKYEALGGEELVAKLWLAVKKLMGHILPRKIKGYMRFGLDDPAVTGYITAFLAPFYPVYGRNFSLEPDFSKETFAADCEGSGKIFIIYIIYLIIWLLLDKNVRKLIRFLWRGKKKGT